MRKSIIKGRTGGHGKEKPKKPNNQNQEKPEE